MYRHFTVNPKRIGQKSRWIHFPKRYSRFSRRSFSLLIEIPDGHPGPAKNLRFGMTFAPKNITTKHRFHLRWWPWMSRELMFQKKLMWVSHCSSRWWFQTFFFLLLFGMIPMLTNIFQRGRNHQPEAG